MNEVRYSSGLQGKADLFALTQQANALLADIIAPSLDPVTVEWDVGEDALGRSVLILRLSDFAGSFTGTFEPKELQEERYLPLRFRGLWGRLLQQGAKKQLEALIGQEGQHAEQDAGR
jgi:hypothetical protein